MLYIIAWFSDFLNPPKQMSALENTTQSNRTVSALNDPLHLTFLFMRGHCKNDAYFCSMFVSGNWHFEDFQS